MEEEAVRVTLLGQVALEGPAGRVDEGALSSVHARIMLAYLVREHRQAASKEDLAEAIWPDERPMSWESMLRTAASRLRAFLAKAGLDPSGAMTTAFGCYQLHLPPDRVVDVEEAVAGQARAEAALAEESPSVAGALATRVAAMLGQTFLAGVTTMWAEAKREELAGLRLRSLETASRAASALGDGAAALAAAEEAVTSAPYRESAYRTLMAAHAGAGNRAEALRAYATCRRLLGEELGVDPSPETEAVYLDLLGSEPVPAGPTPTVPAGLLSARGRTRFVGREPELKALAQLADEAAGGSPRVVLLAGEAGVGKTALAAEAARGLAEAGAVVLFGRCEADLGAPYQPFAEALATWSADVGDQALATVLGARRAELARLVPALGERLSDVPAAGAGEPVPHRVFEAVSHWLGAASAARPVVLVVDDLHWATRSTLSMLLHLAHQVETRSLLILACYRDTELSRDHSLTEALAELARFPRVTRMPLKGLGAGEVAGMVADAAGAAGEERSEALAQELYAQTAGNPFFVGEVLRHLGELGRLAPGTEEVGALVGVGVPGGVRHVVRGRLGRLPAPVGEVLRLAAVMGDEVDLALLNEVSGLDEEAFIDAVDGAIEAGMLLASPGSSDRVGFAHALVRATVYEDLSFPRRRRLHRRVAMAMATRPEAGASPAQVARHFAQAAALGEVERLAAVAWAERAGDQARTAFAFEEAGTHYRAALDLTPVSEQARRCDLGPALGEALKRVSGPSHREELAASAADARALGDPERLARVALAWVGYAGATDEQAEPDWTLVHLLEEALDSLGEMGALRARLLAALSFELFWSPADAGRRTGLGREAIRLARASGDQIALAEVLVRYHLAAMGPDSPNEWTGLAEELIELGAELDSPELSWRGWLYRCDARLELGDVAGADIDLAMAGEFVARLRQSRLTFEHTLRRVGRVILAGDLAEGERLAQDVVELGQQVVPEWGWRLSYLAYLSVIRVHQGRAGEVVEMVATLARAVLAARPLHSYLCAEAGRLEEAGAAFEELAAPGFDCLPHDVLWLASLVWLAPTAAALGDGARAAALYSLLAPYAGRVVWCVGTVALGPVDLALGLCATTSGDLVGAAQHFADAEAQAQRIGAACWLAHTRLEWATLLARSPGLGGADRSRHLAEQALAGAREAGMAKVAARARALLV